MRSVRVNSFPDCCKAVVFNSFGGHGSDVHDVNKALTKDEARTSVREKVINYGHLPLVFAILNHKQEPLFGGILRENGFRVIDKYRDAHTTLHVYCRNKYPTPINDTE